jgi:hypothetical protein
MPLHPPYSLDISPPGFHLFGIVKRALIGRKAPDEIDLLEAVMKISNSISDAELQRLSKSDRTRRKGDWYRRGFCDCETYEKWWVCFVETGDVVPIGQGRRRGFAVPNDEEHGRVQRPAFNPEVPCTLTQEYHNPSLDFWHLAVHIEGPVGRDLGQFGNVLSLFVPVVFRRQSAANGFRAEQDFERHQ